MINYSRLLKRIAKIASSYSNRREWLAYKESVELYVRVKERMKREYQLN